MRYIERARREYGAADLIIPLNLIRSNLVNASKFKIKTNMDGKVENERLLERFYVLQGNRKFCDCEVSQSVPPRPSGKRSLEIRKLQSCSIYHI